MKQVRLRQFIIQSSYKRRGGLRPGCVQLPSPLSPELGDPY